MLSLRLRYKENKSTTNGTKYARQIYAMILTFD
jgi:hypothetical protein